MPVSTHSEMKISPWTLDERKDVHFKMDADLDSAMIRAHVEFGECQKNLNFDI